MRALPLRWLGTPVRWTLGGWPLIVVCLILAYFGYHAVHGERGFLAWMDKKREIEAAKQLLARLTDEREHLDRHVAGLKEGQADRDLVEEELRKLGYIRQNEVIVLSPEAKPAN